MTILVLCSQENGLKIRTPNGIVFVFESIRRINPPIPLTNMTKEQCIQLLRNTPMDDTVRAHVIEALDLVENELTRMRENEAFTGASKAAESPPENPNSQQERRKSRYLSKFFYKKKADKHTQLPVGQKIADTYITTGVREEVPETLDLTGYVTVYINNKKMRMVLSTYKKRPSSDGTGRNPFIFSRANPKIPYSLIIANHIANTFYNLQREPSSLNTPNLSEQARLEITKKLETLPEGLSTVELDAIKLGHSTINQCELVNSEELKKLISYEKVCATWAIRHPAEITQATVATATIADVPNLVEAEQVYDIEEINSTHSSVMSNITDSLEYLRTHADRLKETRNFSIFGTEMLNKDQIDNLFTSITTAYRSEYDMYEKRRLKFCAYQLRIILIEFLNRLKEMSNYDEIRENDRQWLEHHAMSIVLIYAFMYANIKSVTGEISRNKKKYQLQSDFNISSTAINQKGIDKLCNHIELKGNMAKKLKKKLSRLKSTLSRAGLINDSDNAWIERCISKLEVVINSQSKPPHRAQCRPF